MVRFNVEEGGDSIKGKVVEVLQRVLKVKLHGQSLSLRVKLLSGSEEQEGHALVERNREGERERY